jgi:hypothetical protein
MHKQRLTPYKIEYNKNLNQIKMIEVFLIGYCIYISVVLQSVYRTNLINGEREMKTKSRAKLFLSVVVASFGLLALGVNSVNADSNQAVSQSQTSEKQMGKVVVQYVDQFGDYVFPSRTDEGEVGIDYHVQTSAPVLADATVQWPSESDFPKTYTAQTQYITFKYTRELNAGTITVQFKDDAGNQVAPNKVIQGYIGQAFPWYIRVGVTENSTGRHIVGDTSAFNAIPRTVTVVFDRKVSSSSADTTSASQDTSQAKDVKTVQSNSTTSNSAVLPNTNASKSSVATVPVLLVAGMIVVLIFGIGLVKNKK